MDKIMKTSRFLFSIMIFLTISNISWAYDDPACSGPGITCTGPLIGDWGYGLIMSCAGTPIVAGGSLEEQIDAQAACMEAQGFNIISQQIVKPFTSYAEPGAGSRNDGITGVVQWMYGLSSREVVQNAIKYRVTSPFSPEGEATHFRNLERGRELKCPVPFNPNSSSQNPQSSNSPFTVDASSFCFTQNWPDPNLGGSCRSSVGNPCRVDTGNKFASEVDIEADSGLSLTRFYNSFSKVDYGFGIGWSSNLHSYAIRTTAISTTNHEYYYIGNDGKGDFPQMGLSHLNAAGSVGDVSITKSNGSIEKYGALGLLQKKMDSAGNEMNYVYDDENHLLEIINWNGQKIVFEYNESDHISSILDTSGNRWEYEYDSLNRLVVVTYPDLTPDNDSDNPKKIYHYENEEYIYHLTGISDENGHRFGSYAYDSKGKVVSTEHSSTSNLIGQERFELEYID